MTDKKELGLLVDVGRKFWAVAELKELIVFMSEAGLTHLQLHFSENLGFRLGFDFVSRDGTYSFEEIQDLLSFARNHGIEIVPDVDMPGHMQALLQSAKVFALPDSNGTSLDVTNYTAVQWLFSVLDELLDWFSECQIFHIGGDEFIDFKHLENYPYLLEKTRKSFGDTASGLEFYVEFINEVANYLTRRGKTVRVWNDGLHRKNASVLSSSAAPSNVDSSMVLKHLGEVAPLTKNVEICYWSNWDADMAPVEHWIAAGYSVVNFCDNDLYYVLGERAGYAYPTVEKLRQKGDIHKFSGNQMLTDAELASVRGTYFSVWADDPAAKTVSEILDDLRQILPVFAEKYNSVSTDRILIKLTF